LDADYRSSVVPIHRGAKDKELKMSQKSASAIAVVGIDIGKNS
jgi:hypothetical protein